MKKAINIVKEYGYELPSYPFKKGEYTKKEGNTFIYKSIPEGLLYLFHEKYGIPSSHQFKHISAMIDLSRNQVFKVAYFKEVLIKHALLGFDEVWLYIEDTYELKKYPKFGYMRGRYSKEEIQELVAFAKDLGIELIPCVQTLGHMSQFLKWFSSAPYKDTFDILKVGSDKTYEFLDHMMETLKSMFDTTKIHVGMDEAFGLGFGRYYKENGYTPQPKLFMEHLIKVNDICLKHGFRDVYIWSDMFFRMHSEKETYYDPNITFDNTYINQIPKNIGLVYWDYYNSDKTLIKAMLERHLEMNRKLIVASGTWVWTKLYYDKTQTDKTALPLIEVCQELGIEEINFTQWQDDGAYCDYDSIYLGLFDVQNKIRKQSLDVSLFQELQKLEYDKAVINSRISYQGFTPINLLWDDLILGIYVNERFGYDPSEIDKVLIDLEAYLKQDLSEYVQLLAKLFHTKLKIRRTLLYQYQNKLSLTPLNPLLMTFDTLNNELLQVIKKRWLKNNKIFGLEVLESRLEVFRSRSHNLRYIISEYEEGNLKELDFLEQPLQKEPYLSPKFSDMFYGTKVF